MQLNGFGSVPITIMGSLFIALSLMAIRMFFMQRAQQSRQRENRQETERLKSLVACYRSLAGSFSPPTTEHASHIEESLADIVLFGSLSQVELAIQCLSSIQQGDFVDYQALIDDLRSDLRNQLGLEPLPNHFQIPASGPGRSKHMPRNEGIGGRGEGAAGGTISGGAAMGAGGGLGVGMLLNGDCGKHD